MAFSGPSDNELHIDNASAVLTDWSASCVGSVEEQVAATVEDKTPVNSEEPVNRSSGFKTMSDFTFSLDYTTLTRAAFIGSEGSTRTVRTVDALGQMDVEAIIVSAKVARAPKVEAGPLELVLRPTGAWAYT